MSLTKQVKILKEVKVLAESKGLKILIGTIDATDMLWHRPFAGSNDIWWIDKFKENIDNLLCGDGDTNACEQCYVIEQDDIYILFNFDDSQYQKHDLSFF